MRTAEERYAFREGYNHYFRGSRDDNPYEDNYAHLNLWTAWNDGYNQACEDD